MRSRMPGGLPDHHHPSMRIRMSKFLSALTVAAFAFVTFGAQAASHTGGAPMKASEPAAKASGAMKKESKKMEKKAEKKEEMKK